MIEAPLFYKLVSVVIPCYNSGSTILQSIESVRNQTWPKVEIIVVDDGSNDADTITILDSLEDIALIRQDNAGLPAARNVGFNQSSGYYVLPLDADDWLEPDAISCLIAAISSNEKHAFSFSYMQLECEVHGVLKKSYNYFEQLFLNQIPYCILLTREAWISVGGYDESMRRGYEDWEFNIRLGLLGYSGYVVTRPLFHYRVSSKGMLISQSNNFHGELWKSIQQKHAIVYKANSLSLLWWKWRSCSSTYPISLYFLWFLAHKILPNNLFNALFKFLRTHSHSIRVSRQYEGD